MKIIELKDELEKFGLSGDVISKVKENYPELYFDKKTAQVFKAAAEFALAMEKTPNGYRLAATEKSDSPNFTDAEYTVLNKAFDIMYKEKKSVYWFVRNIKDRFKSISEFLANASNIFYFSDGMTYGEYMRISMIFTEILGCGVIGTKLNCPQAAYGFFKYLYNAADGTAIALDGDGVATAFEKLDIFDPKAAADFAQKTAARFVILGRQTPCLKKSDFDLVGKVKAVKSAVTEAGAVFADCYVVFEDKIATTAVSSFGDPKFVLCDLA